MARVTGEGAPAFTSTELERLVDGVLPQYGQLYGPPDQQVRALQKKGIWRVIAKDVRTLGVYGRHKWWDDLKHWARKKAEAQLGMASQRGRGARPTLTPPDGPHTGGGLSRAGWALENITAATRR
ncbi:hypothetical protein NDU88_003991 [Pleurodeles waltl]|uniref:Myb/SANT-like DNA-binding domain-containing protein n=1 Tax=Pleurodeles waltl TaxID=8319 RepID=A0AAV7PIG9_PLEWA|nr:hypothetical protein NDU88_003991 [Pleurodeles waltl]